MTIEMFQILPDLIKIYEAINRPPQVILRAVVFQKELMKQRRLCLLPRSHHREISQSI